MYYKSSKGLHKLHSEEMVKRVQWERMHEVVGVTCVDIHKNIFYINSPLDVYFIEQCIVKTFIEKPSGINPSKGKRIHLMNMALPH